MTTTVKLTAPQERTLRAIADAEAAGDPVYRFSTLRKLYNVLHGLSDPVVTRLLSLGLVTLEGSRSVRPTHHVTKAGRAYLDAR